MKHRAATDLTDYARRYDYTAYLSKRDWAFEYLRRNPKFQKAAWAGLSEAPDGQIACHGITVMQLNERQPEAEAWGLKFFCNPDLAAPNAPVFWTSDAAPLIVQVTVVPREPHERHALFEKTINRCRMLHLTDYDGSEHLVHIGKASSVQVACTGHTLVTTKPVKTFLSVGEIDDLDIRQEMVKQTTQVYGDHVVDPPEFSYKARLARNGLIALDGYRAGLTDREVAYIIDGYSSVQRGIENGDRSLIRRVKTYRDKAIELSEGGYRDLLLPANYAFDRYKCKSDSEKQT